MTPFTNTTMIGVQREFCFLHFKVTKVSLVLCPGCPKCLSSSCWRMWKALRSLLPGKTCLQPSASPLILSYCSSDFTHFTSDSLWNEFQLKFINLLFPPLMADINSTRTDVVSGSQALVWRFSQLLWNLILTEPILWWVDSALLKDEMF